MNITRQRGTGVDFESYVRDARKRLPRFVVVVADDPELVGQVDHPHANLRREVLDEAAVAAVNGRSQTGHNLAIAEGDSARPDSQGGRCGLRAG